MLETLRNFRRFTLLILFLPFLCATTNAQQPFVTDDTDTTPKHHFHFEFSNELDVLQRASFPSTKQNTADSELDFGLSKDLEIGIEVPYLTIFNARNTAQARFSGVGDTNLSLKYNFLKEDGHSRKPALAIALNLELPTGNVSRQLGSGLADFYMNGISKYMDRKRPADLPKVGETRNRKFMITREDFFETMRGNRASVN